MEKFAGFIVCLIISLGLLTLSLISDSISCSRVLGFCTYRSNIKYLNIELNRETFPVSALSKVYCERQVQPSRNGKRAYYLLKIDINERPYNISSYNKSAVCKTDAKEIRKFIKNSAQDDLIIQSGTGFLNSFGIIFAVIIFIIGLIILKTEPAEE